MTTDALFAGDFDQLEAGASFATPGRTVTEADIVSFAALTGDWHPQHADAQWAADSHFGARVAHGMLVLSYAVGLASIDPSRVIALRGIDGVAFKRPVLIGDTIHLEGQVDKLQALSAELGLVTFLWRIVNQSGKLVVRARVTVLWRRGDEEPSGGADEPLFEEVYL